MNTHVIKTIGILFPSDLKLIWRDGFFLSFIVLALPLTCFGLRWLVPYVTELVAQWVALEPYYGLIVASTIISGQPVMLGFVIGMLFVEERDQGTLLALQTSPLSLRTFLGYRLLVAMLLNVILTTIGIYLSGLVSVPLLVIMASAALASLGVPLVVLVYATYIKNKVQALMLLKPVQIWGGFPTLLFFAPAPLYWIGSIFMPLYYPMRLFVGAANGAAEWWLLLPGVMLPGIGIFWLFRRFERAVVE